MAAVHDRILEFNITLNAAADTLAVDSVNFYRDRGRLDASDPFNAGVVGGAASVSPQEVQLSGVLPPPTHYRFVFAAF